MTSCCCAGEHGAGNTTAGDDAGTVAAAAAGQQAGARGAGELSTPGTPCSHTYAVVACGGVISM